MHGEIAESSYTQEITNLVKRIVNRSSLQTSLYEQASHYFQHYQTNKENLEKLSLSVQASQTALAQGNFTNKQKLSTELEAAQALLLQEQQNQKQEKQKRYDSLFHTSESLVLLSEASDQQETLTNSAKLLGTLLLLSPHEGSKLAIQHQKLKPVYKAVLALRLLDKLLVDNHIATNYILQKQALGQRYSATGLQLSQFQHDVCIPIVIAALIQDIGLQHPQAQHILKGENGDLDEFRVLKNEERLSLLKINYQQTLDYLVHGIGLGNYNGNSKEEKSQFDTTEIHRQKFITILLNDSIKPKQVEGHLLKIPQIYASVIFSTKPDPSLANLPKATLVLEKAAEIKSISAQYTKSFIQMVGHFPQGFGVTYIPKDDDGHDLDRYEYAIVCALNPVNSFAPICRTATRHLTFNSAGKMLVVPVSNNLYFATTRKKFAKISPNRLNEILSQLCSNFEERKNLELIPSHWNPYTYFGYKKFQNLWKKAN
ncbi:hypothetical protein [Flavobacterium sp. W21_SRS_FM6]|uniref:hypothetical protein n=1 Tax=Flavobacterium sp. W21_SRS_FM6 TaxID=3240268 RepID=UPI003F905AD1